MAATASPPLSRDPVLQVINPRTGDVLHTVQAPSDSALDQAYATARQVFARFRPLRARELPWTSR